MVGHKFEKLSKEDSGERECFFCGRSDKGAGVIEKHHIIPKSWSKREGFENKTVNVCSNCHRRLHKITSIFKKDREKWIKKFEEIKEKKDKIIDGNVGFLEGNTVKVSVLGDDTLYGNVIEANEESIKICTINNPNKIEKKMFDLCKVEDLKQYHSQGIYKMVDEKREKLRQGINMLSKGSEDELEEIHKFWRGWRGLGRQLEELVEGALVYKYIKNNPKCTEDEIFKKIGKGRGGRGIYILKQLKLITEEKIKKEIPTTKKQTITRFKMDNGEDRKGE